MSLPLDLGYNLLASSIKLRESLMLAGRGSRQLGYMPLSESEVARLLVALANSQPIPEVVGGPLPQPERFLTPVFDDLCGAAGRPPYRPIWLRPAPPRGGGA